MHFRRWTRMTFYPAIKYFNKYGLLDRGYQKFMPLLKLQDPQNQNKSKQKLNKVDSKEKTLDTKLIDKLFLKYPDLKYQPISHRKYAGRKFNTFSYAYSFIQQQKKLIKEGYEIGKAFQIVQKKYQQKMQRKLDQTLLSRGLAIGNRARSFLTIYQQQVEEQSRLKVLRTKRQVEKYEDKLNRIRNRIEDKQNQIELDIDNYERMFTKIIGEHDQQTVQDQKKKNIQNRNQYVNNLQTNFKNIFNQFYERAASKDRLEGLTDEDIINKINSSPTKIKRQTRILIQYLKKRGSVSLDHNGEVRVSQSQNPKLRQFLLSSPQVKIALINEKINYQKPWNAKNNSSQTFARRRQLLSSRPDRLTKQEKQLIKKNKKLQLKMMVNKQIPIQRQSYKIFESEQERLIRLQLKFLQTVLQKQLKQLQQKRALSDQPGVQRQNKRIQQTELNFKELIQKFRRIKYRLQSRYKRSVAEQFLFKEHYTLKDKQIQKDQQYQALLVYLRKKTQERRLTSLNQYNDNKVQQILKVREFKEGSEGQGQNKKIQ